MDEIAQANHELDRLQGIITRHEGHMFALRGWLLAIVGGLLAAYYTENIDIDALVLRIALFLIAVSFLVVELRHVNLVEAVVERVGVIEKEIAASRRAENANSGGWYDGPKVSKACQAGANRWLPRQRMTFVLNQPFYIVVILIILFVTVSLPPKVDVVAAPVPTERPGGK